MWAWAELSRNSRRAAPHALQFSILVDDGSNDCRNFPNAERVPTVLHADIVSAEDKRLHPQMPTDKINVSAHCANTTAHARQGEQHRPKPHRPPLGKVQEEGNESQVQQQLFSLLKPEGRFAALSQATVRRFLLWYIGSELYTSQKADTASEEGPTRARHDRPVWSGHVA